MQGKPYLTPPLLPPPPPLLLLLPPFVFSNTATTTARGTLILGFEQATKYSVYDQDGNAVGGGNEL